MRWGNVHLVFRRELRDALRDRRTVFLTFVLPVVLYPAIMLLTLYIQLAGRQTLAREQHTVAVIGLDVGGVAALGAAALDHSIRAIVIAGVEKDLQTAVSTRLSKVGMIGDFFTTAYVLGYKTYFRAHDRQLSSWELAESLSENQSLLIFSRKDQMSVKEGAAGIAKYAPGETQIAILGSEYSQVLTNASGVGLMVVEFLDSSLGTAAENGF